MSEEKMKKNTILIIFVVSCILSAVISIIGGIFDTKKFTLPISKDKWANESLRHWNNILKKRDEEENEDNFLCALSAEKEVQLRICEKFNSKLPMLDVENTKLLK